MNKNQYNLPIVMSTCLLLQDHRKFAHNKKVSQEMSDLVVYCISKPFKNDPGMLYNVLHEIEMPFEHMSSFDETYGKKHMIGNNCKKFQVYHQRQLSRIYPDVSESMFKWPFKKKVISILDFQ